MSEFHNDNTAASDPIPLRLSDAKLRWLHPDLYGWRSISPAIAWGNRLLTGRRLGE
jgi:hypothetical protein